MNAQSGHSAPSVAIVTGISRGYGKAIARVLLLEGWNVVGDGRDQAALARTAMELPAAEALQAIPGDITDEAHLQSLIEAAQSRGVLRLIVNNAGTLGPSPLPSLASIEPTDLEELFQINTIAALRLIQLAMPNVTATNGVVINVTSDASAEDYPGWGGYSATKIALEKLTSVLAVEAPTVRFYSLDPGDMRTDMHQAAFPGEDISDRNEPEVSAPAVVILADGKLPSGRYRAEDILHK